eukprot:6357716-Ditylum_brightwellii.AAC.1
MDQLIQHFTNIKQGLGSGPFGDATNSLQNLALHQHCFGTDYSCLQAVLDYLCLFALNDFPDKLFPEFSSVWLTLLHKEWPLITREDPKYCPISIGTGLRCCIA